MRREIEIEIENGQDKRVGQLSAEKKKDIDKRRLRKEKERAEKEWKEQSGGGNNQMKKRGQKKKEPEVNFNVNDDDAFDM